MSTQIILIIPLALYIVKLQEWKNVIGIKNRPTTGFDVAAGEVNDAKTMLEIKRDDGDRLSLRSQN